MTIAGYKWEPRNSRNLQDRPKRPIIDQRELSQIQEGSYKRHKEHNRHSRGNQESKEISNIDSRGT